MFLVDGDLKLRAIEPTDDRVLYTLINDPGIESAVVGWSGPVSLASQADWISKICPDEFRYVVEVAEQICGVAMINPVDFKNRTANVNIKLLHDHAGRGVGTGTIRLLAGFLFRELDMEVVTAGVLENNIPSRRMFERLGFVQEGVLRSRVFKAGARQSIIPYSMLRAEYQR